MDKSLRNLQRMKQVIQGDLADVQCKIDSHRYEHPKYYPCSTCGELYLHDEMFRHSMGHCVMDDIYLEVFK